MHIRPAPWSPNNHVTEAGEGGPRFGRHVVEIVSASGLGSMRMLTGMEGWLGDCCTDSQCHRCLSNTTSKGNTGTGTAMGQKVPQLMPKSPEHRRH